MATSLNEHVETIQRECFTVGPVAPADPDTTIARIAVSRVMRKEGRSDAAAFTLSGVNDQDPEIRIALETINVLRQHGLLRDAA